MFVYILSFIKIHSWVLESKSVKYRFSALAWLMAHKRAYTTIQSMIKYQLSTEGLTVQRWRKKHRLDYENKDKGLALNNKR